MVNFREVGRKVGERVAARLSQDPSGQKIALDLALGAIEVMAAKGMNATVPKLLEDQDLRAVMAESGIGESTFKTAMTEARKQWATAQAESNSNSKPIKSRRKGRAAKAAPAHAAPDLSSDTAASSGGRSDDGDGTGGAPKKRSDLFGGIVNDVPIDEL